MMERFWKHQPRISEDPHEVDTYYASAMRNDGQMFMVHMTRGVGASQTLFINRMLQNLDSFLRDDCQCVVGKNCEIHKEQEFRSILPGQNVEVEGVR